MLRVVLLLAVLGAAVAAKVDPECHMTPSQIALEYGYHLERHWVTTDDGYILEVHRLPAKSGAPVVFLQHGLLDSSITWMLNAKKGEKMAFKLYSSSQSTEKKHDQCPIITIPSPEHYQ